MRVALMKSIQAKRNASMGTATIPYMSRGSGSRHLRERDTDVSTLIVVVAMVVIYAVMAVALYRWSAYAPVFQPDGGAAAQQAIPWPQ
jgi:hypothetical protein